VLAVDVVTVQLGVVLVRLVVVARETLCAAHTQGRRTLVIAHVQGGSQLLHTIHKMKIYCRSM
jgi:hypothetical protein